MTRDTTGRPFYMKGGPWDGIMLRIFETDYDGWYDPNHLGKYLRPPDVDANMPKAKPNKTYSNVPHMIWIDQR